MSLLRRRDERRFPSGLPPIARCVSAMKFEHMLMAAAGDDADRAADADRCCSRRSRSSSRSSLFMVVTGVGARRSAGS